MEHLQPGLAIQVPQTRDATSRLDQSDNPSLNDQNLIFLLFVKLHLTLNIFPMYELANRLPPLVSR